MGLRGGWAVDLHAGAVTREHDDIDIAVWLDDVGKAERVRARVVALPGLRAEKAETRDDPRVAANDRADPVTLGRLG